MDKTGRVKVKISIDENQQIFGSATTVLSFLTEPALIDIFVEQLKGMSKKRKGEASIQQL